jgi:hypothetical protein
MATKEGILWLYAHCNVYAQDLRLEIANVAATQLLDEFDATQPMEDFDATQPQDDEGIPLPLARSYFSSGTMQKARDKRRDQPGVPVHHKDRLTTVYAPITVGQDAFKLRALKDLVGIKLDGALRNVFDRLELDRQKARPRAPPVGTRPWFYSASATGKQAPHTQVLHTRKCTDRMNGNDFSSGPDYDSDAFQLHEFDFMQGPPVGIRTVFCKMCKEYSDARPAAYPGLDRAENPEPESKADAYPDMSLVPAPVTAPVPAPEPALVPVSFPVPAPVPKPKPRRVVVEEDTTMCVLQLLVMQMLLRNHKHE